MDTCSYFWVGKGRASSQASHGLHRKVVCFTPWKAVFEEKKVGTFHSTKKSCLNFRSIYSNEWNGIFHNFKKTGQPREVYPNFRNFFPEVFFPFNFALSEICRIFSWMVHISEIQQLREFLETFSGKSLYHLFLFSNFKKFGWMESVHCFVV